MNHHIILPRKNKENWLRYIFYCGVIILSGKIVTIHCFGFKKNKYIHWLLDDIDLTFFTLLKDHVIRMLEWNRILCIFKSSILFSPGIYLKLSWLHSANATRMCSAQNKVRSNRDFHSAKMVYSCLTSFRFYLQQMLSYFQLLFEYPYISRRIDIYSS